jgi:hypothetical protein
MIMNMFATLDKAMTDTDNIVVLNLTAVKHKTVVADTAKDMV